MWQTSDILYYEVLDIPLPELQGLKTLKVAFHHATMDEVSILIKFLQLKLYNFLHAKIVGSICIQVVVHTIRLPKQSTVGDVINDLKTKVWVFHAIDCRFYLLMHVDIID